MRKSKEEILDGLVPDEQINCDEFYGNRIRFAAIDDVTDDLENYEKKANLAKSYWKELYQTVMDACGCSQSEIDAVFKLMTWDQTNLGFSDMSMSQIENAARESFEEYKSMSDDAKKQLIDLIPDSEKYAELNKRLNRYVFD